MKNAVLEKDISSGKFAVYKKAGPEILGGIRAFFCYLGRRH